MRRISAIVALSLALIGEGLAQEQAQPLTADDCVRLALERNRTVQAAREQSESARQSLKGTGAQRLPRVSTSVDYARFSEPITSGGFGGGGTSSPAAGASPFGSTGGGATFAGIEETTTATVNVIEPITDQIGLHYSVALAQLKAAIAGLDQAAAEDRVAFGARQAYYKALTYEKTVESVEQTITELESTLKLTRSLKEAGRVLQRDVNKADIAVERAKLDRLRAEHALRLAGTSLRDVLGVALDAPLEPAPTEAIEPFELTLEQCLATAEVKRPDLRAAELRAEAARRGVALARSAYVPSLGASVGYLVQDTDVTPSQDSFVLGLSWSWDLWDWGRRRAGVRSAQADTRAATLAFGDARNQVALEVERLWLALDVARRKIEVAKKDWDYAVENVRVSREKYEAGALLITDLLDDQTALNDARVAYYVAIYEYAIALADLRRAMGER